MDVSDSGYICADSRLVLVGVEGLQKRVKEKNQVRTVGRVCGVPDWQPVLYGFLQRIGFERAAQIVPVCNVRQSVQNSDRKSVV